MPNSTLTLPRTTFDPSPILAPPYLFPLPFTPNIMSNNSSPLLSHFSSPLDVRSDWRLPAAGRAMQCMWLQMQALHSLAQSAWFDISQVENLLCSFGLGMRESAGKWKGSLGMGGVAMESEMWRWRRVVS